jgi:hypothetical protein
VGLSTDLIATLPWDVCDAVGVKEQVERLEQEWGKQRQKERMMLEQSGRRKVIQDSGSEERAVQKT